MEDLKQVVAFSTFFNKKQVLSTEKRLGVENAQETSKNLL